MMFFFTLSHAIMGSIQVSDPDGWKEAVIGFERHPDFHSLSRYFRSGFAAYGSNGVDNGRRDWLKQVEEDYGPDAEIELTVDFSEEDFLLGVIDPSELTLTRLYTGQVPVVMFSEVIDLDHRINIAFDDNGTWTKFISRFETPVDLKSETSLDGDAVDEVDHLTVTLSPQKVQQQSQTEQSPGHFDYGTLDYLTGPDYNIEIREHDAGGDKNFVAIDLEKVIIDEIATKNAVFPEDVNDRPGNYVIQYAGDYAIALELYFTLKSHESTGQGPYILENLRYKLPESWLDVFIKFGSEAEILFDKETLTFENADQVIDGLDTYVKYTHTSTRTLEKGDIISVYGKNLAGGDLGAGNNTILVEVQQLVLLGEDNSQIQWPYPENLPDGPLTFKVPNGEAKSIWSITAQTIFPATDAEGFFMHDAMGAICDRIISANNTFESEYLGSPYTKYQAYVNEGHEWKRTLFKGLQLKSFPLSEKIFSMSGKQWWDGANPLFNLGLGFVNGKIRVEDKAFFYNRDRVSIRISNVRKIKRSYDQDLIFNQIETGHTKWETEEISGIDDPQTKQVRASALKRIGKKLSILSDWIAASIPIEVGRRKSVEKTTDWRYDNETFVLAVSRQEDGTIVPELDENFDSVTGLLNSDTRYNIALSCAHTFLRWLNFIAGGLWKYPTSKLKFVSGQGNYAMASEKIDDGYPDSYNGNELTENEDITVGTDFLFIPMPYEIECPLSVAQYLAVDADREAAIEISQSETDYKKFFIKDFQYQIVAGEAKIIAWPIEPFNLTSTQDGPPEPGDTNGFSGDRIFGPEFGPQFN